MSAKSKAEQRRAPEPGRAEGRTEREAGAVSPEQARRALSQELANLTRKVREGKTLTQAERVALHQIANPAGGSAADGSAPVGMVQNKTELAKALGVSRRTLQNHWKSPGRPDPRADGCYDLLAFRQWAIAGGWCKQTEASTELPEAEALKARLLVLRIDEMELNLAAKRQALVSREHYHAGLQWLCGTFTKGLDGIPRRLALRGIPEKVLALVRAEVEAMKEELCEYVQAKR